MIQALVCTQDWLRGRNLKPKGGTTHDLNDVNVDDEILVEGINIHNFIYGLLFYFHYELMIMLTSHCLDNGDDDSIDLTEGTHWLCS